MLKNTILFVLALSLALTAQSLDFGEIVTFKTTKAVDSFNPAKSIDVEIDQTIFIEVQELELSRLLGTLQNMVSAEDSIQQRITFLTEVAPQFLKIHRLFARMKAADADKYMTQRNRAATESQTQTKIQYDSAQQAYSKATGSVLKLIDNARERITNPADRIRTANLLARARNVYQNESDSNSKNDVANLCGEFMAAELNSLNQLLMKRLESGDRVEVFMEAWIQRAGMTRQLHLDGYDNIATGRPAPFPRFQVALSERTANEFESAQGLADLIKSSDQIQAEIQSLIATLRQTVLDLANTIKIDILEANLRLLLEDLRNLAAGELEPLIDQINEFLMLINTLSMLTNADFSGDISEFLEIATRLNEFADALKATFIEVPKALERLANALNGRLDSLAAVIDTAFVAELKMAIEQFPDAGTIQPILNRFDEIKAIIGLDQRIIGNAEAMSLISRRVTGTESLDTALELISAGERHPGDHVIIRIRVVKSREGQQDLTIASANQRFRLRALGLYVEPRGAMLFVDPRKGGLEEQSYEPVMGLAFVGHLGVKNSRFWNDFLNPGLGLTFALLDFDESRDLELGAGASLTVFSDMLWVGYGRNIQSKVNFFYFGVNPLAFGNFFLGGGPN